ncbi:hypothetical protein [Circoviridae sp.]|nr:hypothetical protein [Circoviridae sp.]UOF79808.1 hypothetical protein [Circoviridae sp.]
MLVECDALVVAQERSPVGIGDLDRAGTRLDGLAHFLQIGSLPLASLGVAGLVGGFALDASLVLLAVLRCLLPGTGHGLDMCLVADHLLDGRHRDGVVELDGALPVELSCGGSLLQLADHSLDDLTDRDSSRIPLLLVVDVESEDPEPLGDGRHGWCSPSGQCSVICLPCVPKLFGGCRIFKLERDIRRLPQT